MLKKVLILLGMGLLLAGCVLQSRQPAFSESQGAPLPRELGQRFVMENLEDGAWKREEGTLFLRPSGRHYLASDNKKKDEIEALFVPLDENWWVMQAREKGKPSTYILAEVEGNALLLHPLYCDDLKKQPAAAAAINFEPVDCYLKAGQGVAYFKSRVAGVEPAKMRMVTVD
jgi:hypothetical protein